MKVKAKKQLKKGDEIQLSIKHQGAPIVNGGTIREVSKNIIAIEVDLKSKWCDIEATTGGNGDVFGIYIGATERSTNLKKKINTDEPTKIEFPDFIEWDIFCCDLSRYTLRMCLIKK